jgi:ribosomal-protein-alanine N-acetyltransferase
MKEALNEVIDYGFNVMKLHRIQALIADSNTPSKKLLLHYGFVREGTIREDYVVDGKNEDSDQYSLLRQEWKKRS